MDNREIKDWARDAIGLAVKANIIKGYSDGSFRPNASITRAEMAVMITNALSLQIQDPAETSFSDNSSIPTWAKGAINAVANEGIVQGRGDNQFFALMTATRAEAITVIMKVRKQ